MVPDALPHTEVRLPGNHRRAALAREFTRTTPTDWGHRSWQDAAHVVSDLVSNVLLHAHGRPVARVVERPSTVWGVSSRGRGKVVWCDLPAVPT